MGGGEGGGNGCWGEKNRGGPIRLMTAYMKMSSLHLSVSQCMRRRTTMVVEGEGERGQSLGQWPSTGWVKE